MVEVNKAELHVWRAITQFGEICHFGEAKYARAWAGAAGKVERVDLTPVPDLSLVVAREPLPIEVVGYASPGQIEVLRSVPLTGGMKVKGSKDARYTEALVLLSDARAAVFSAVVRCEREGAFKACMECGYQDGHDEICQFHQSKRAIWVPVEDRLPASGRTVLAFYANSVGRVRRIRAQYAERWTIEVDAATADPDTECVEYNESADAFYLLEGWYECIDNWDAFVRIAVTEGQVSHWMPLPAAPVEAVKLSPYDPLDDRTFKGGDGEVQP